jgi:ketosteroid isomerase-like protein
MRSRQPDQRLHVLTCPSSFGAGHPAAASHLAVPGDVRLQLGGLSGQPGNCPCGRSRLLGAALLTVAAPGDREREDHAYCKAMSQADAEKLSQAMASGNPEELFALLADDVEWDYVGAFPESATYYGPAAVRKFFAQWSGAFDNFGFAGEDVIDAGDFVLVHLRQWGRGKETGAQVENRSWQVFTFRDGKIVHCRGYPTKAEALDATS